MESFDIAAPVSEIGFVVSFLILQIQDLCIGACKLRKTKQAGGSCLVGIVNTGDAKAIVTIFFYEKEVVIIMISMQ